MLKLINPAGGFSWIQESRLDEYEARGFKLAPPPPVEPSLAKESGTTKKPPAKKRTAKKEA